MDGTRIGIILVKLGAAFMFINILRDANMFLGYFEVVDLFYFESIRWAEWNYANQLGYEMYSPSGGTLASRYTCILQIIIGLTLLFGRRGLSAALASARGRGKVTS